MVKFQALPKVTIVCYIISIVIIGFVLAEQFAEWDLFSRKVKVGILVSAAIIGVFGSIISIAKQLANYLRRNKSSEKN
ncbi:hypothetical protein CW740_11900 [Kangiella profundi]|uniref:Uncharacterized protein n=1 Tax=Kangiella profundi TaxID=1561924 RepID=A0A2K9A7X7_9GAMM|nr:hypothetical protein [Kangiella profundi]AUD79915.1 hypothetical protein CW740_11900 [Kangiella profundi]GGE94244.1 hypothetical protein GCM10011356_05310 [Kangiella profundi]